MADIARDSARVLDLETPNLTRRELESVENARQGQADEVRPGGKSADPQTPCVFLKAAQIPQRGDIEDILPNRPADPGGIEVGAAGQHGKRPGLERRERLA